LQCSDGSGVVDGEFPAEPCGDVFLDAVGGGIGVDEADGGLFVAVAEAELGAALRP
jgi:hypothetical protein